jgi:PAS domain S-box-containing protein
VHRFSNEELSYFGRIVTSSPLGIAMFDQHGRWLHFNSALSNLLGYTKEELTDTLFFDHLMDPSRFSNEILSLHLFDTERITKQLELSFIHKNGTQIWTSMTCSLLPPLSEETLVYSVQIMDLTPQKKAEDQLLTTDRLSLAGQLAAGMAHEVRNPLTAIKGFVQLLKRENENGAHEYLDVIESEVNRMESMLSEFLLLGKPRNNKKSQIHFENLITHVVALLHSQALMNHIDLVIKIDKDIPYLFGNETQLKQVFINLLKNAIESMEMAGSIHLTVKKENHHIVTTIIDQGPGISEEMLKLLGSAFYSTKEKGTGLGLMMCFIIVKEHNGTLHISSSSLGTTVDVLLPLDSN